MLILKFSRHIKFAYFGLIRTKTYWPICTSFHRQLLVASACQIGRLLSITISTSDLKLPMELAETGRQRVCLHSSLQDIKGIYRWSELSPLITWK